MKTTKRIASLFLSLIMMLSVTAGIDFSAYSAENANAKAVVDNICSTSGYRPGIDNYNDCYAYASAFCNKMYGSAPGGTSGYTLTNPGNFYKVGQETNVNASSLANLLSKAMPGDVIQMYWFPYPDKTTGTQHTAIVYSANSTSFTMLQDGADRWMPTIKKSTYSYASNYTYWSKGSGGGITLYRYNNYNTKFGASTTAPTKSKITVNKLNYKVNENVNFSFDTDGTTNTLWVYCPNGQTLYYQGLGANYTLAFGMAGYYEGLVETWNGIGSKRSEKISWYVGPPQYAYISLSKNSFAIGETVTFTFNTAAKAGQNTLWIYYPDGTSKYYKNCGNSHSLSFSNAGTYQALVQAWNDIGEKCSEKISFTIGCNHSYTSKTTTSTYLKSSATCTSPAIYYYKCANCSSKGTNTYTYGSARGHSAVSSNNSVKAACATVGKESDTKCSVCGVVLTTGKTIPATGHTPVTCNNGYSATCGKAGKQSDTECATCGEVLSVGEAIPKTNKHTYGTGKVTKAPTSSTTGVMTYTCKTCSAKKTATIAKLAKASISKLTAKSKGFGVSWKKVSSATGYQIQYSTSSKFTSPTTVTITKNSTLSKSITKLKAKKKYYVRIRTYKTIAGKKYYSAWSGSKYVTTKK